MAAVGAGTRHPVIGAGGEMDGFHAIARRRTVFMAGGFPMMAGETSMDGEGVTVPTTIGARSRIPTEAGEAPPVVGVIHNQSPPGLSRCYLGQGLFFDVSSREQEKIPETSRRIALAVSGVLCMRLRLAAFCFARVALRT